MYYCLLFLQFYLVFTDVDVIIEEIDKSSGISKQQTLHKCEMYRQNVEISSIDGNKSWNNNSIIPVRNIEH